MRKLRYTLSAMFLEWGIKLIPDEYPRQSLQHGINFAADMMLNEMKEEEEYLGEMDNT